MKFLNTLGFAVLMLITLSSFSNAQLLQLGAGGGLTQILAPNGYTDAVGDGGYGFSTEWNAGAIVKIGLPLIPLTPRAYFLYHSLSGNGEISGGPDPINGSNPNADYTQTISEIGIGLQYNFVPLPVGFDPYIALDLSFNSFGMLELNGVEVPNTKYTRFGGGIGLGTEVSIIPLVNLDFYLSYKMFNITGKEDGEDTISAVTLDAFIIFNFL